LKRTFGTWLGDSPVLKEKDFAFTQNVTLLGCRSY